MKLTTPFVPALVTLTLVSSGCASSDGQPDDAEMTELSESDLTSRHHFDLVNPSAEWKPGCGIVREGQPPCQQGLFVTFTKHYADLAAGYSVRVDNARNVITLTTDTWSYSTIHSHVVTRPQTVKINPPNLQSGRHYAVVINNYKGRTLVTDNVYTVLAM